MYADMQILGKDAYMEMGPGTKLAPSPHRLAVSISRADRGRSYP